jgi:peptide/nickel transport system permease protein
MGKFIFKRVLWIIPVCLGVLLIVFSISYFAPGDPVMNMLGTQGYTPEAYAALEAQLGLDKPFLIQYVNYVVNIVTKFDFGTSYTYGHAVGAEILARMGVTLKLGVLSVLVMAIIGIPCGIISATKQYSPLDYCVTILSLFFAAMPNFWLALVCIIIFSLKLGWFPPNGMNGWRYMVLPVVTNAMCSVASVSRMSRSSMLEVIRADYIRTARAKGCSERTVILRHALRNAIIPIMTVVGMQLGSVVAGSVVIETIFGIPGLGSYMMNGISGRDYPIINACVLVLAFAICLMNLVVDVAYAYVDPRIHSKYMSVRKQQKKETKAAKEVA